MSVYFVSGHLDLTEEEFATHYKPQIDKATASDGKFIVGDARGADCMAQKYLHDKAPVTVYHMFKKPRNNYSNSPTIGGFTSDADRDARMTADSDFDILWVRPAEEQKKLLGDKFRDGHISGTEKNRLRRV